MGRGKAQYVSGTFEVGQALAAHMQIPGRGLQRSVAQEHWHGARIHPCVQEMGGKAVPKRMNAPPVGKPRPLPSALRALACRATGHGARGVGTRKEPRRRPLQTPIGAQFLSEAGGEESGAILLALALIDADPHALWMALNVGDVEVDHCTDA